MCAQTFAFGLLPRSATHSRRRESITHTVPRDMLAAHGVAAWSVAYVLRTIVTVCRSTHRLDSTIIAVRCSTNVPKSSGQGKTRFLLVLCLWSPQEGHQTRVRQEGSSFTLPSWRPRHSANTQAPDKLLLASRTWPVRPRHSDSRVQVAPFFAQICAAIGRAEQVAIGADTGNIWCDTRRNRCRIRNPTSRWPWAAAKSSGLASSISSRMERVVKRAIERGFAMSARF